MTEVLQPPGIHRSHTAPSPSISGSSASKQDKRVIDWQFDVAKSNAHSDAGSQAPSKVGSKVGSNAPSKAGSSAPPKAGSTTPTNVGSKAPSNVGSKAPSNVGSRAPSNVGSRAPSNVGSKAPSNIGSIKSTTSSKDPPPSLPRSKAHSEYSATATSTTSASAQELFKQVPSLYASRQHEDYEFDYDGRVTSPLGVSRIIRRHTTTTTCSCFANDDRCRCCSSNEYASQMNISIQNTQQTKEKDDGGIDGKTVISALLGVAAGAAVAYTIFSKLSDKKEDKEIERDEPIRMVSRSPSMAGSQMAQEKSYNLDVIAEDMRADHETSQPETKLTIMSASGPVDENVGAENDRMSGVAKTLVSVNESRSVAGSKAKSEVMDRELTVIEDAAGDNENGRMADTSITRSRAPGSFVSARSHVSTGSARRGSQHNIDADKPDDGLEASSKSDPESEQEIAPQNGSYVSAKDVPLPESVVSRHSDRRSHISSRESVKAESVASHRSRRSHRSTRHEDLIQEQDGDEERGGSSRCPRSYVSAKDIPLPSSEVSSRRSHVSTRDRDDDHHSRNRSKDSRRSRRRSHASGRAEPHDNDGGKDQHRDHGDIFRETEHSTDSLIGANFASKIAAIARDRLSRLDSALHDLHEDAKSAIKSETKSSKSRSRKTSHTALPHEIPLPDSDARSCLTAREIPLPESELGGACVVGGVYGGGGCGLGLGSKLSARFVELPESDIDGIDGRSVVTITPEDSISNIGERRRRRK